MNERFHIEQAIAGYQERIELLKKEGIAPGCVAASKNGAGKTQHHYVLEGKRVYLRKSAVRGKRQECQRWKRVQELERRIGVLRSLL